MGEEKKRGKKRERREKEERKRRERRREKIWEKRVSFLIGGRRCTHPELREQSEQIFRLFLLASFRPVANSHKIRLGISNPAYNINIKLLINKNTQIINIL